VIDKQIIKITRDECKSSGVSFYRGKGSYLRYGGGVRVNGFFESGDNPKLAVATKAPNWVLILAHELSHLRQWWEKCKEWVEYEALPEEAVAEVGKVHSETAEKSCYITMLMERDCEKRAYTLLQSLGYPEEGLKEYIKKANAYTIFYKYLYESKKWYVIGREPYNIESVWGEFPDTFDIDIEETYSRLKNLYSACVKI